MTDEELRARYPGAPIEVDLRSEEMAPPTKPKTEISPRLDRPPPRNPEPLSEKPEPLAPPDAEPSEPSPGGWIGRPAKPDKRPVDADWMSDLPTPGDSEGGETAAPGDRRKAGASTFFGAFSAPAEVSKVIDGDTFSATITNPANNQKMKIRVRLRGIDAPEIDPSGAGPGIKARDALGEMLKRGGIKLSSITIDRYGRAFATVSVNGIPDVGEALTKGGYASSIDLPKDWPKDNEWRKIHATAPADKVPYIKWITEMSRRLAGMVHSGSIKKADSKQYAQFIEQAEKLMREYIRPWRKSRGINPVEQAFPSLGDQKKPPTPDGQKPAAPDTAPRFDWQKAFADLDRPMGRSEWASWEKSLWPEEKTQWRHLRVLDEYFRHNMPRDADSRERAMRDPDYMRFRRYFEKFLNLTTKRWRKYRDQHGTQRQAPRRRRYSEADVSPYEALGAVS